MEIGMQGKFKQSTKPKYNGSGLTTTHSPLEPWGYYNNNNQNQLQIWNFNAFTATVHYTATRFRGQLQQTFHSRHIHKISDWSNEHHIWSFWDTLKYKQRTTTLRWMKFEFDPISFFTQWPNTSPPFGTARQQFIIHRNVKTKFQSACPILWGRWALYSFQTRNMIRCEC